MANAYQECVKKKPTHLKTHIESETKCESTDQNKKKLFIAEK